MVYWCAPKLLNASQLFILFFFLNQKVVAKKLTTPKYIIERRDITKEGAKPNPLRRNKSKNRQT
jgi:hypothetical protein